jgi:hypothetical protein
LWVNRHISVKASAHEQTRKRGRLTHVEYYETGRPNALDSNRGGNGGRREKPLSEDTDPGQFSNTNSERRRQMKVRSNRAREETQVERYSRSDGRSKTKPRNGDEDREI